MARHKDVPWDIDGSPLITGATLAVLMDIRDELKRINIRLDCGETLSIPRYLSKIARHTGRIRPRERRKK